MDSVIGTFGQGWNHLRGITTIQGDFDSIYEPKQRDGSGEKVYIRRPDGAIVNYPTPSLIDWRLTVQDGMIAIRWLATDRKLHLTTTTIAAGGLAGATVTGTNPPPPTGDGMDAAEVRAIVKAEIKPVLDSLDSTWDDLKNRIAAVKLEGGELSEGEIVALAQRAADRVLLGEPQQDHYGLPEMAQFGTRFQETIAYMLMHPQFLEAFLLRLGETIASMKARGVIPEGVE